MAVEAHFFEPGLDDETTGKALSLHYAGASAEQIAVTLHRSPGDVQEAIERALEVQQPGATFDLATEIGRINALWRALYAKAVGGDVQAQTLALKLSQYRTELTQQAARTRSNEVELAVSTALEVAPEQLEQAFKDSVEDDFKALDALWRVTYMRAVSGEHEAAPLASSLLKWRAEFVEQRAVIIPEEAMPLPETPGQTVRRAASMLAGAAPVAVRALELVARRGRSESARVAAARALLDRAGLAGAERIEVSWASEQGGSDTGNHQADQLALLKSRLQKIHEDRYG